jgi:thiamine-phosphate pyrophosphorylase
MRSAGGRAPLSAAPKSAILCYVTDRNSLAQDSSPPALLASIRNTIAGGVDWVQIREKNLPTRELLSVAREAIAAAAGTPTRILVNDRLDVALAAGAAGVHLGGESVPVGDVVRWCRAGHASAEFLVGASCHRIEEAIAGEKAGADYIFFGPIFATPSKLRFGPPLGTERLAEVCGRVRIPVLAIGGVNGENAADCFQAGAAGIAAIRLFQEAEDRAQLKAVLARLRKLV